MNNFDYDSMITFDNNENAPENTRLHQDEDHHFPQSLEPQIGSPSKFQNGHNNLQQTTINGPPKIVHNYMQDDFDNDHHHFGMFDSDKIAQEIAEQNHENYFAGEQNVKETVANLVEEDLDVDVIDEGMVGSEFGAPEDRAPEPEEREIECLGSSSKMNRKGPKFSFLDSSSSKMTRFQELKQILAWRDIRKSSIIFITALSFQLILMSYPVLYIICNLLLLALIGAIFVKIYFKLVSKIKGEIYFDPFAEYLKENDSFIDPELSEKYIRAFIEKFAKLFEVLQVIIFGSELLTSIKFGLVLYLACKISRVFSGLSICVCFQLLLFSCPIVYEHHWEKIDECVVRIEEIYREQVLEKIDEYLPNWLKLAGNKKTD